MDEDAITPVVGTILLVAITMVLAGVVFLLVSGQSDAVEPPPRVAFQEDPSGEGGTLTVAAVNGVTGTIDWDQVSISSASTAVCTLPTGTVNSGDLITCSGEGTLALAYQLPSGDTVLLFDGRVR